MALTNRLQRVVDLPAWEWMRFSPVISATNSAMVGDWNVKYLGGTPRFGYYANVAALYRYDTVTDGWQQLANDPNPPTLATAMAYNPHNGHFGRAIGPGPSKNTIQMAALQGDVLVGSKIWIYAGSGAGQERTIVKVGDPVVHDSGIVSAATSALSSNAYIDDGSTGFGYKNWKFNQWRDHQVRLVFGPATAGPNQIRRILYNLPYRLYFTDYNHSLLHGQFAPVLSTAPTANATFYNIESSIVTVDSNWTTPPDWTSRFVVKTGGIWRVSGTASAPFYVLSYYDIAADVWYIKSTVTNLFPYTFSTMDVAMEAVGECCGGVNTDGSVATPLASKVGTLSTPGGIHNGRVLIDSGQNMAINQHANMMLRITGGKGRGQRRAIIANSHNRFIVGRDWEVTPDNTSTYQVLGDSNKLYMVGGATTEVVAHDIAEDMAAPSRAFDFGAVRTFYAEQAPYGIAVVAVGAGGTGYAVGDILTLTGNSYYSGSGATVRVLTLGGGNSVATVEIVTAGTGYPEHATAYATTGGSGDSACTITVSANSISSQPPLGISGITRVTGGIYAATVGAAGTGYRPGDLLTVSTGTAGFVRVLTVTSVGGVSTFAIEQPGSAYGLSTYATTNTVSTTGGVRNTVAAPSGFTVTVSTICDVATATTGLNHNFTLGDVVSIGGCDSLTTNLSQSYYGGARAVVWVPSATTFNFYVPTGCTVNATTIAGGVVTAVASNPLTAGVGYSTGTGMLGGTTIAVNAGGSGYAVGDLLLVSGGKGGFLKVATLTGTAVATVTMMNPGTGYSATNGIATVNTGQGAYTASGGGAGSLGSGCTVNLSAVGMAYSVTGGGGSSCLINITAVGANGAVSNGGVALVAGGGGTGYSAQPQTLTLAPSGSAALFNAEVLSTNLVIIDNTKNWMPNEHAGKIVEVCLGGPAAVGQFRRIVANTSRTLLVGVAFSPTLVVGTYQYLIMDPKPFGTEWTGRTGAQGYSWGVASGGTTGTLIDAHTGIAEVSVASGGSSYVVGDVLTLDTGTEGKVTVTSVASGVVTGVSVTAPGTGYTAGNTYGVSGGGGFNCRVKVEKLDGKNWAVNQWAGRKVKILAGTGVDSFPNEILIASNDATTLTFASGWTLRSAPDTTTVYAIMDNWGVVAGAAAGGLTLTVTNGVVTGVPANATVNTAGSNYVVGDVLWVNGGTALGCFVKVLTLSGSGVATFTVLNPGCGLVTSTNYASVSLTSQNTSYILASGGAVSTVGSATTINDPFQLWGVSNLQTKRLRIMGGTIVLPALEFAVGISTATQLTVATTTSVVDANQMYAIMSTLPRPTSALVGVSSLMRVFGSTSLLWPKGRYMLSWRGCATSIVERYDLCQMIWDFMTVANAVSEVHTIGSMFTYDGKDRIYFTKGGESTGRVMCYDIPTNAVQQCGVVPYGMSTGVQGNRIFTMSTNDLYAANMEYLYIMRHSGNEFWRTLVFW